MKKLIVLISMLSLTFMFLGCPNPNQTHDPIDYTVTFSTEHGTAPEAITVEEDSILTAEQLKAITADGFIFKGWFDGEIQAVAGKYKVTKDVNLTAKWESRIKGSAKFPFEFGKTYVFDNSISIQFNSDGSAKYEKTYKGVNELIEGYEYNYVVDTDKNAVYCYVDKYYYKELELLTGWVSSNEFGKIYNNFLSEDKLRKVILNNDSLKQDLIETLFEMKFDKEPDETELEEFVASLTDDEIWDAFKLLYSQMVPNDMDIYEYYESIKPLQEKRFDNVFATVQKYQYVVDETTGEPKSIKRVIYEEATLKDMISPSAIGYLCWESDKQEEKGQISKISLRHDFQYSLSKKPPRYDVLEIKDGYIYIDERFILDEEFKKDGYKEKIDPIPYTETGKGENLVVTITFEGTQYELKYDANNVGLKK